MKKTILAILSIIPLLTCCNNNSKGFVDPFPNDPYNEKKIGFNFSSEEKIKRVLTSTESELLEKTLKEENLKYINEELLTYETGEIHERDYTRAFAGVFGSGYNISNMMYDEDFKSFYQKPVTDEPNQLHERKKTVSDPVKSTYDYSYGRNETETVIKTLRYFAKNEEGNTYTETDFGERGKAVIDGKYEVVSEMEDDPFLSASIVDSKNADLHINQSGYIFKPSVSDPLAGAFDDKHIIIIHEQHDEYGKDGTYTLPDGREYRAAINSLIVTRLFKAKDSSSNDPIGDYYLVERSRTYQETAITSDVIRPNVPITFLKNPIVINYKEEIHHFLTSEITEKSDDTIDPVVIES